MDLFSLSAQISVGIDKAIKGLSTVGNKANDVANDIKKTLGGDNELNIETDKAEKNLKDAKNDLEEFDEALEDTEANAESSSNGMMGTFKKLGAAVAAAFAVDKIIDFGKAVVTASAEVAAEEAAFSQIMGDYTDEAQTKINKIADATGIVSTRLTPYMTSMTAKFKGLGYDIDDATSYATRGLNLAADASAFWDMSLDDSMSHLNSFINGSYEGGEAIGLFANDTQMAAYAVEKGLVKETSAWSSLDEATKQATRLEYAENMFKQSGAVGQAAKESESYANVQANLTEKWRQFKAQVGEPILQNIVIPAMKMLGDFITNTLVPTFENLKAKLTEAYNWYKQNETVIKNVAIAIGVAGVAIGTYLVVVKNMETWTKLATIAQKAWGTAVALATGKINLATIAQKAFNLVMNMNPIGLVVAAITALVAIFAVAYNKSETFRNAVNKLWAVIKNSLLKAFKDIKPIMKEIVDALMELWDVIKTAVMPIINLLVSKIKQYMPTIKAVVSSTVTVIITVIKTLLTVVKTVLSNIKAVIQTTLNVIKNVIKLFTSVLKGDWKGAWEALKNIASSVLSGIKNIVSNSLNGIKGIFSNVWNGIKSVTSKIWNGIKNSVTQPVRSAMETVQNYISKIKNAFGNITTKIKMPHIKIQNASWNPKDWIENGIPRFSVEWYKDGGIMTKPTLFDYNPSTNTARVGGEAGAEAIAPIDTLMGYVSQAVKKENEGLNYTLNRLYNLLVDYLPNANQHTHPIYVDGRELARALTPEIDNSLGNLASARERGR